MTAKCSKNKHQFYYQENQEATIGSLDREKVIRSLLTHLNIPYWRIISFMKDASKN